MELAVKNSYFLFNNDLYFQLEGVGMGLPLGPTFANTFMCYHEKKWIQDCPSSFKPILYRRYIDDCFVLFNKKENAEHFLDYINNKHSNIKFTSEVEIENKISFLDIQIERDNDEFVTSVFRKKTFSGLASSYFGFVSRCFKISPVKTLIYRAFNISSKLSCFDREIQFLRNYFCDNGYTSKLFNNLQKQVLNKIYNVRNVNSCYDVKKLQSYFKFEYFGPQSEKLKIDLDKLILKYFPYIDAKLIFINNFKTGNFFKFKDVLPKCCENSVVYQYCCASCGVSYVGSTIRALHCRVQQHAGRSFRTGQHLSSPDYSVIRDHCQNCNGSILLKDFSIIGRNNESEINLRILETLFIKSLKPGLNQSNSAVNLFINN